MSVTRLFRAVSWLLLLVPLFGCPPETTEDDDDVVDDDDSPQFKNKGCLVHLSNFIQLG